MDDILTRTAYCGLYCGDCIPMNESLFDAATALAGELDACRFDLYADLKSAANPLFRDYPLFRSLLSAVIELQCPAPCRAGGGKPVCMIRDCALEKNLTGCWECDLFETCERIAPLLRAHGDPLRNRLRRMHEHGLADWPENRGPHYRWQK